MSLALAIALIAQAPLAPGSAAPTTRDAPPTDAPPTTASATTTTPAKPARTRLVILDLDSHGVDGSLTKTISDDVAVAMTQAHIADDVASAADLRAQLGIAADKQLAGCEGKDECMAEVAQALGADLVVHGSVGRLGEVFAVTLSLYDAKQSRAIAREKVETVKVEQLGKRVEAAAQNLALAFRGQPTIALADDVAGGRSMSLVLAGAGVGVVGVAITAITGALAAGASSTLASPSTTGSEKAQAEQIEVPLQFGALAGAIVALAGGGIVAAGFVGDAP